MKKCSRGKFWISIGLVFLMLFTIASMSLFAMETAPLEEDELVSVTDEGALSVALSTLQVATRSGYSGVPATGSYNWTYGGSGKTFFNDDEDGPCLSCHPGNGSGSYSACYIDGSCDCVSFNVAIQCCGYAQLVFHHLTGFVPTNTSYADINNASGEFNSKNNLETFLSSKYPIYVRLRSKSTGGLHYICIIENYSASEQLVFCDANGQSYNNRSKNCGVRNEVTISYDDFLSAYSGYTMKSTPKSCPHSFYVWNSNSNYHWYTCGSCRDGFGDYMTHNFSGGSCTDCMQPNTHTQTEWRANVSHHWKVCVGCCDELQVTNRQLHDFGIGGVRCACGALNASINGTPDLPELN